MSRSSVIGSAVALAAGLCLWASGAGASENRCGWYMNPTPGNYILVDRDASWWILAQGQDPDAVGMQNAPDFDPDQYVETQPNGYGYGCACLRVDTDAGDERITMVYSGRILPLSQCRQDKSLPAPPDM